MQRSPGAMPTRLRARLNAAVDKPLKLCYNIFCTLIRLIEGAQVGRGLYAEEDDEDEEEDQTPQGE